MQTVLIEFNDIPNKDRSSTPALTHCRRLLKEGYPEDTRVEFQRNGRTDLIVTNIGEAAKLTVDEEPNCRFVKYKEPKGLKSAGKVVHLASGCV